MSLDVKGTTINNTDHVSVSLKVAVDENNDPIVGSIADPNVYIGTVVATECTYEIAKTFSDIDGDNVKLGYTVDILSTDKFFIIMLEDGSHKAFAVTWIDSISVFTTTAEATLTITGITSAQAYYITEWIKSQGYNVTLTKFIGDT